MGEPAQMPCVAASIDGGSSPKSCPAPAGGSRGARRHWPLVRAAAKSRGALAELIKSLDSGRQPHVIEAPAGTKGRIFYRDDVAGFNFTRARAGAPPSIGCWVSGASRTRRESSWNPCRAKPIYLDLAPGTDAAARCRRAAHLDRQRGEGECPFRPRLQHRLRRRRAAALHSVSSRADRQSLHRSARLRSVRRPDEPGPVHESRSRSLPALRRSAAPRAQAELGPGDALFIPFGWWHHVESLTPFNVLVNYWWNGAPDYGAPHGALLHALLTIRDLPPINARYGRQYFGSLFSRIRSRRSGTLCRHARDAGSAFR